MVEVRSVGRAEAPEAAALMARHFGEDQAFFTRMLGLGWDFGFDEIGKGLFDGERLVGFFGLHHSRRTVRGQEWRFTGMHGVVVDPGYRGRGTNLLTEHALDDPDGNFIAWTANPAMDKRYRRAGFEPQDPDACLLWPGSTVLTLASTPFLRTSNSAEFDSAVDAATARIFRDHRGTRLREHLFRAFGRPLGLLTRRTYHERRFPVTELAFVNDPQLLRRVFEPVRLQLHRRERTVAMRINPLELGFTPPFARRVGGSYLYRSRHLGPGDFRALYGELLILG